MENDGIWEEQFTIRAFMVDKNRNLRPSMLCNLLQEVAGNHANFRHLGFFEMQAQNRFWVLNRLKVEFYKAVNWQDQITIKTWVSLMRGPFSHRNFSILNKKGEEVASAFTLWVALDATSRKPIRIDPKDIPVLPEKEARCGQAAKVPPVNEPASQYDRKVRNSDLDMIGHVNNVKYIEWALDTYRNSDQKNLKALEVNYLGETGPEEAVQILRQSQSDKDSFSMKLKQSEKEVCRVQIDKF